MKIDCNNQLDNTYYLLYQFEFQPKYSLTFYINKLMNPPSTHDTNRKSSGRFIRKVLDTVWCQIFIHKLQQLNTTKYIIQTNKTSQLCSPSGQRLPQGPPFDHMYCHNIYNINIYDKSHIDKSEYILQNNYIWARDKLWYYLCKTKPRQNQ